MGDTLQRVANTMREIVHWVNAPVITSSVVTRMNNPINYGVSKVNIWRAHINLEPDDMLPFFELAVSHSLE